MISPRSPQFELRGFARLRTPDEFAAAKMGFSKAKEERRQGFLTHQAKSLPTSLTQLDTKHEREEAVQMFKGVLGYVRREIASSNACPRRAA